MTWTTLSPYGVTVPLVGAIMALTLIALVYALGLLYSVVQMGEGHPTPDEGLEEGEEP